MSSVAASRSTRPNRDSGRGRRFAVRALAVLGLLTFGFMLVFVVADAAGRVGEVPALEPAGSVEARYGADHPGELLHLVGALGALGVGASGLIGLIFKPERGGAAIQTAATALAMLFAALLVGNADNFGGQAGLVDPAFLIMAVPVLAAAAAALPLREWRDRGLVERPPLLVLAAVATPAMWFGVDQALMQRNTWPPPADPHHQAHWYAMAVLGLMLLPVTAGAALRGRGWRAATTSVGLAAAAVALASLVAPGAASALHPAWALAALSWSLALLLVTWRPPRRTPTG